MTIRLVIALTALIAAPAAFAHAHSAHVDESNPDAWKIKLCNRMSDVALQALGERDKDKPMKLYEEDSEEAQLANAIIRQIYAEPQVSSPKKAMVFGRGKCNEFLERRNSR